MTAVASTPEVEAEVIGAADLIDSITGERPTNTGYWRIRAGSNIDAHWSQRDSLFTAIDSPFRELVEFGCDDQLTLRVEPGCWRSHEHCCSCRLCDEVPADVECPTEVCGCDGHYILEEVSGAWSVAIYPITEWEWHSDD